jgi:hypothetical protein
VGFSCTGDCDHSGDVAINELVIGAAIVVGTETLDRCRALDGNDNATATIEELLQAVGNGLEGCDAARIAQQRP